MYNQKPKIDDLEKVGNYACKKNLFVNLNTNGTLIDKERAKKIAISFDHIRISLDGSEDIHDNICGIKGTYKKVIRAIEYLIAIKNRRAKVGINYVFSKENIKRTKEFSKIFHAQVDFISFLPEFCFRTPNKDKILNLNDVLNSYDYLEHINKSGNTKDFIINTKLMNSKESCDVAKLYLMISPGGKVFACPFVPKDKSLDFYLGSIYENNLFNIFQKNQNKLFSSMCYGCYAICTTEVSRIFRMSPFKLIKNFFYFNKKFKL